MLNSKPNNKKYNQGNYIPKNKDKILKLNAEGGVFYRSGYEKVIMVWLDNKKEVTKWGAECMSIPYQMTHFDNGDTKIKSHTYFPDFYYEMRNSDGVLKQVVVEVKPWKEYKMVQDLNEGKLKVPEKGLKKLRNFEYDIKAARRNKSKWEAVVKWCKLKGYEFIIITEKHLDKFNVR